MQLCKKASSDIQEGDFTSMIDMVFQLIAFFMVLINFNEADTNERIKLPGSELARPPDGPITFPITMHVTREGTVIIGGEEIAIAGLKPYLLREQAALELENRKLSDATVIIRGDADAKTGKVQEVIQECQKNKFEKFALRAKEDVGG
jgi:biopolymer transport protein ExbD